MIVNNDQVFCPTPRPQGACLHAQGLTQSIPSSHAGKGRGLVATRPLQPRELVLVSQPVGVVFGEEMDGPIWDDGLFYNLRRPRLDRATRRLMRLAYDGTPFSGKECPDLGG